MKTVMEPGKSDERSMGPPTVAVMVSVMATVLVGTAVRTGRTARLWGGTAPAREKRRRRSREREENKVTPEDFFISVNG